MGGVKHLTPPTLKSAGLQSGLLSGVRQEPEHVTMCCCSARSSSANSVIQTNDCSENCSEISSNVTHKVQPTIQLHVSDPLDSTRTGTSSSGPDTFRRVQNKSTTLISYFLSLQQIFMFYIFFLKLFLYITVKLHQPSLLSSSSH